MRCPGRPWRLVVAPAIVLLSTQIAAADDDASGPAGRDSGKPVVLLNAAARLGGLGPVDKLRRVLDARGLLHAVPEGLAAALDGRNLQITDADAIRDAYKSARFEDALQLVAADEARILQRPGGDPLPALAELAQWRGLIAVGLDDRDGAVAWFRAALRFNPAWTLDTALAGPKVERLIQRARKEVPETGKLHVIAEPEASTVQVDGGRPRPTAARLALPAGHHLVTIAAEARAGYSQLVDIVPGKTVKVSIALERETESDRAARLVDAAVAAPAGEARLRQVSGVARLVGATRFLVIEDTRPERTVVRVYDVDMKKISRQIDVEGSASSAVIARKVLAALEPENLIDADAAGAARGGGPRRWYERWYVWAGVGAVVGGGALGYYYSTREPTALRGF